MSIMRVISGVAALLLSLSAVAAADSFGVDSLAWVCGAAVSDHRAGAPFLSLQETNCNTIGSQITVATGTLAAFQVSGIPSMETFSGGDSFIPPAAEFFLNARLLANPTTVGGSEIRLNIKNHENADQGDNGRDTANITSIIPEPGSLALFGTGLIAGALGGLMHRRVVR